MCIYRIDRLNIVFLFINSYNYKKLHIIRERILLYYYYYIIIIILYYHYYRSHGAKMFKLIA